MAQRRTSPTSIERTRALAGFSARPSKDFDAMVAIRPVSAADEAEWRRLWTAYLTFYEASVTEEVYATTFARLMRAEPMGPLGLVAEGEEGEGRLIGLVHYMYHPHCWQVRNVCYLQDLYADPDARGKGVGRALIEAVYAAADAAGAPAVYWLTQDFNAEARRLYDRIATVTPFVKYKR